MGRDTQAASQITGHHLSVTAKKNLIKLETEITGDSNRLEKGLDGLSAPETSQLNNQRAKQNYHILALEASKSSAIANIHIPILIQLANELATLKDYEKDIKEHKRIIFVNGKPIPNPVIKMRTDSLKAIDSFYNRLGLGASDIASIARQKLESQGTDGLKSLFAMTTTTWEEKS